MFEKEVCELKGLSVSSDKSLVIKNAFKIHFMCKLISVNKWDTKVEKKDLLPVIFYHEHTSVDLESKCWIVSDKNRITFIKQTLIALLRNEEVLASYFLQQLQWTPHNVKAMSCMYSKKAWIVWKTGKKCKS